MNAADTSVAPSKGVTDNGSAQVSAGVTRNACSGCEAYERRPPPENKSWGFGSELHCTTCHGERHIACWLCGACLPTGHRYDRRYCSSTCRVRAHKRHQEQRLERAAWEAENPEEARKQAEEREVEAANWKALIREFNGGGKAERFKRNRDLKDRAESCAQEIWHADTKTFSDCLNRFEPGAVIYRRRKSGVTDVTSPVFPYCREHRCGQPDGYHTRNAPDGRYFASCACEDSPKNGKYWSDSEPCLACGRLVAHPKYARLRRGRGWLYQGEKPRNEPRPFCSEHCRGLVVHTERKAARLAERGDDERPCMGCALAFKGRRRDAHYCSVACWQRAYRQRLATREAVL